MLAVVDSPHQGGDEEPHTDAVDEHDPQKQLQGLHKAHVQNQSETHRGHCRTGAENRRLRQQPVSNEPLSYNKLNTTLIFFTKKNIQRNSQSYYKT